MSVLAPILVLAILIFVHELGHFAAARFQGIRVNRFSLGFGPALVKYQGKETEYAIRALPLGGYVGFPDEDPDSQIPKDDPNLLSNRPIFDRAIVISAGVIANLIFAYFLLVSQAATIGIPDIQYQPGVKVPQVMTEETSAAYKAGIKAGDIIIAVDGEKLEANDRAIKSLMATIQNSPDRNIELTISRGEEIKTIEVIPTPDENGQGKIGVMLQPNNEVIRTRPENILQAFSIGADEFERITKLTFEGFGQLLSNFQETAQQVAGPVAIVAVGAQIAQNDIGNMFQFAALISINLAIINSLPIPALDGGQLVFLAIEGLSGKPVPNKLQEGIMQTGLVLLLGLGMFLIVRDTANLEFFQQLF